MPVPATIADPAKEPAPVSSSPASLEVVETPEAAAPAAEDSPAPPTILQRAQALVKPKANLQAEVSQTKAQLAKATDALALANGKLAALTEANAAMTLELVEIEKVVEHLEGESKTANQIAIDMVAATGLPAAELPAQDVDQVDTLESLQTSLSKSDDPREKGVIAAKIRELR